MRWSHFRRPLVLIAAAVAGLTAFAKRPLLKNEPPPRISAYARIPNTTVEARVASHSSPKRGGERFWIEVDKTGPRIHKPVRVLAYISRKIPEVRNLRPGHRVRLSGKLRLPFVSKKFDEAAYMARRRASFVMHVKTAVILEGPIPLSWRPLAWGEAAHRNLQDYLKKNFSKPTASVLEGLLLGYRGRMKPDLTRAIQDAGVMHLLTPSGAKVTILWVWALAVGTVIGIGPSARWSFAVAAGGLYLCIVGFEPPYTRAYLMGLILFAGRLLDRRPGAVHAWAASALISLCFWPQGLFSPGFQMTYLAMLGLLVIIPRFGASPFVMTAAVQAALLPPLLAFFGKISLAGFFVNLVCVPASAFVAGLGFFGWATGFSMGLEAVIQAFCGLCRFAASRSWAVISFPPLSPIGWLCYYTALFSGVVLSFRRAAGVCMAAAGFAVFSSWKPHSPAPIRLQFRPWGVIVGAEGKDVYCVRTAPSGEGLLRCPMRRTFSTREEGPIRVHYNGRTIRFQSTQTGDSLGGPVS